MLDKRFKYSIILSLITHSLVLAPWHGFKLPRLLRITDNLEVSYLELRQFDEIVKLQQEKNDLQDKIRVENKKIDKPIQQESLKIEKETPKAERVQTAKFQKTTPEPKPSASAQTEELVTYLDYYQALREKIKSCAHKNYPKYNIQGEVFVSFTILSDGTLAQIKVIDERSDNIPILKSAAIKSLEEASPFAPFPKEIKLSQMNFNLPILFELGKSGW